MSIFKLYNTKVGDTTKVFKMQNYIMTRFDKQNSKKKLFKMSF